MEGPALSGHVAALVEDVRDLPVGMLVEKGVDFGANPRGNSARLPHRSSFGTLKTELGESFETHADAERQLFDYIEVFYNQRRRHSSIGYVSPAEFERVYAGAAA